MYNICDLRLETVDESQWIRIKQVNYKQNGIKKSQEITCSHNSCGILIHNKTRDVFVFVRQFRPAVFMHEVGWESLSLDGSECISLDDEALRKGFTLELCAGILDKEKKTVAEIAADEVLEECGYRVSEGSLELILATRNNSLHSGTLQHLFYAQVTDDMKVEGRGGGIVEEGEFIDIVEMNVAEVLGSLFEDSLPKPIGLTFALVWFLFTKTSSSSFRLTSNGHDASDRNRKEAGRSCCAAPEKRKRGDADNGKSPSKKPRLARGSKGARADPGDCDKSRLAVTDVEVSDTRTGRDLQIYRLHFRQKDFRKAWDFFYVRSVCTTLVHNTSRNVFFLVRRFSPAVYASLHQQQQQRQTGSDMGSIDPAGACLTQLCSTSFEKGLEPCMAASDSVLDTFGYRVPPTDFRRIIRSRSNVGIAGALLTLFYVKVTDEMKVPDRERPSPPNPERDYDIVEVPVTSSDDGVTSGLEMLMLQGKNPMSLSLALLWYYYQDAIDTQ